MRQLLSNGIDVRVEKEIGACKKAGDGLNKKREGRLPLPTAHFICRVYFFLSLFGFFFSFFAPCRDCAMFPSPLYLHGLYAQIMQKNNVSHSIITSIIQKNGKEKGFYEFLPPTSVSAIRTLSIRKTAGRPFKAVPPAKGQSAFFC